jgi:MFS family permease
MGVFINILFFGSAFVALAVAGGFATNAAVRVTGITGWDKDKNLDSAHKYLSIAAVVTWITVAVILVLGIVYIIFFMEETLGLFTNLVIYAFLFLSLAATAIVGVLSAIAAQKIADSKTTSNNSGRTQAIVAAVLAIVATVSLFAAFIASFFKFGKKKDEKKDEKKSSWLSPEILESVMKGYGSEGVSEV